MTIRLASHLFTPPLGDYTILSGIVIKCFLNKCIGDGVVSMVMSGIGSGTIAAIVTGELTVWKERRKIIFIKNYITLVNI